ncbi:50S ribosomal protein L21e [Candidatus Woesearchaeota archaeon CG10_big_fil_rev_8_21_14_0_10_37_12]|nr:MAG: 50S ribosomal protein L21e [Candidatus Woesearchaeota archaeon CG10_big_fil_rev_8_21_14_0_10_37_12]
MGKRKGGSRAGTRRLFRKHPRTKGKISLTKFFTAFKVGDKTILSAEPAVQKNLYHRRFHSRPGVVTGKRGNCYEVQIKDGNQKKLIIVHPVHLRRLQ